MDQVSAQALKRAALAELRGLGVPEHGGPKLRRLDVEGMAKTTPEPVSWVVQDVAARAALAVVAGRAGTGKSMIAGALAVGVAAGVAVAGIECQRGRVLIVDAENGEGEIHRRVHALGIPPDGSVAIYEPVAFDLRHDLAELESVIAEERSDLVVLDSMRPLWGGDEDSSAETRAALDPFREMLGRRVAAGILVHHETKASGETRGSGAIEDAADIVVRLSRDERDRRMEWRKCRIAAEPEPRTIRIGAERGRIVVEEVSGVSSVSDAVDTLRTPVLDTLVREGPLRLADVARGVGCDPKNRTVRRVLDELVRSGEVRRRDDLYEPVVGGVAAGVSGVAPLKGGASLATPADPGVAEHPATFGEELEFERVAAKGWTG